MPNTSWLCKSFTAKVKAKFDDKGQVPLYASVCLPITSHSILVAATGVQHVIVADGLGAVPYIKRMKARRFSFVEVWGCQHFTS